MSGPTCLRVLECNLMVGLQTIRHQTGKSVADTQHPTGKSAANTQFLGVDVLKPYFHSRMAFPWPPERSRCAAQRDRTCAGGFKCIWASMPCSLKMRQEVNATWNTNVA